VRSALARVDLEASGTFTAAELPQFRVESPNVRVVVKSGGGTWKMLRLAGEDVVQLVFADGSGSQFKISTSLESQPKLYYFLGDPDSGQRLEFVRGQ
jgi:hypothetical protein